MSVKTYYEIKDMICEELDRQAKKGKINSPSELDVLDKLTHSLKSIATIIAMEEAGEDDDDYSERGGSYRGGNSYRGQSNRGGSYRGESNRGGSYRDGGSSFARGRSNARRDSMGRYSRAGNYSRGDYSMEDSKADMIEQMRMMMETAPDEMTRSRYQDMIRDMETM